MPRTPPPTRADYRWFCEMPTRWIDNDAYGHMNNIVHYSLFDTAISNWQLGRDFHESKTIRTLVVESGCVYHAEAAYPDLITGGVRVGHIGRTSWRYDIGLFRNEEDVAFASGFFAQVSVDAGTGAPSPLSAAARAHLQELV